jgi:hypothetical protein
LSRFAGIDRKRTESYCQGGLASLSVFQNVTPIMNMIYLIIMQGPISDPQYISVIEWVELYLHSPSAPSWRGAQLGGAQGQLYLLT